MNTKNPSYKFKFIEDESRNDFGGHLEITAETPEAKQELLRHFRVTEDPLEIAKIILAPEPYTHVLRSSGRDNGAVFEINGCLPLEFSDPYFKELHKRAGFVGRGILPDIGADVLTPRYPWGGLRFTHYMAEIWTEGGHVCFKAYVTASDWNGMTAADYAERMAYDYVSEELGTRKHESEYIEARNGMMKRNPNYLKRHKAEPGFTAQWFFSALVDWWLANEANDAQRDLAEKDRALMFANHKGIGTLRDVRSYDKGLRESWDGETVKWLEFQNIRAAIA